MAKLTLILCFVLLMCVLLSSAREIRGFRSLGGSKRGSGGASNESKDKGSGGKSGQKCDDSAEREVTPITKEQFKTELGAFVDVFTDASSGVGRLESLSTTAHGSQELGDWINFYLNFIDVATNDLAKLGPAVENLGFMLERIAESPDEFPPLPYCDSSVNLAAGNTPLTTTLMNDTQLALIEDLGCFKNSLLKVTAIDVEAAGQPEFTELQAIQAYVTIIEEVIQLGKALERFGEAQEELQKQIFGVQAKREEGNNADIKKLIHLLRELKLDKRR